MNTFQKWLVITSSALAMVSCTTTREAHQLPAQVEATLPIADRPDVLTAMVSENQIMFRGPPDALEAVCWCGPKVEFHQIAQTAREAIVAIEDRNFWNHRGVDLNGKIRAGLNTLASALSDMEGGSSLTEQLIKNTILTSVRGIPRKVQETILAYRLEEIMPKADILESYLNQVHFGHVDGRPIVGIQQASLYYFGRNADELNLLESAILAGMVQAPSMLDYFKHREDSLAKAKVVLAAMVEEGYITQASMNTALESERPRGPREPIWAEVRSYMEWVLSEVKRQNPGLVLTSATRIPIALQVVSQAQAEGAFEQSLEELGMPRADAGYLVMGFDGRVIVMIGQRDHSLSQINFVTHTNSQAASAFKPFVYAAALENGAARFSGKMTAALARSDNAMAIELANLVGVDAVAALARRMGIASPLRSDPSLALGGSEVNLLELTTAFVPFANEGMSVTPYGHFGIVSGGAVVSWTVPTRLQVIDALLAERVRSMLVAVVDGGTASAARAVPNAAGKTGTSDGPRDGWFIGMTGRHVSGIWVGRADDRPIPGLSGALAARVWAQVELALPNE